MRHLAELGQNISGQIGASQAREVVAKYENIRKRWRCVYTEVNLHRQETEVSGDINANVDKNSNNNIKTRINENLENVSNCNLNGIADWCEKVYAAADENINFSDLKSLNNNIFKLKQFIAELPDNKSKLELLSSSIGQNSPLYLSSQSKLQKINFLLPKRLSTLQEKSDTLHTMVESVKEKNVFIKDLHKKFDTAKTNEDVNSIKVAIGEIEYSIQKLFNDYSLLEKEVLSCSQKVRPDLLKDISELRSKWTKLNSEVKQKQLLFVPSVSVSKYQSVSVTGIKEIAKTSSSYSVSSIASQVSAVSSVSQTASEWACRSTNTGTSEQWATSPTTGTNSPMSDEAEEPKDQLALKTAAILAFIKNLTTEMGNRVLDVMDTDIVGKELDRIRSLLAHLDSVQTFGGSARF